MSRTITQSRIRVEVEVSCGTYGAECTMEQIIRQASEEGIRKVNNALNNIGRVVGEPVVRTITTIEESPHGR